MNGKLTTILMAPGLLRTKVADGSVKTAPLRVDGTPTMTVDSLELGGAMIITREESGRQKMLDLISKLLQLQSISKLVPGSVQMAALKALGSTIL